MAQQNGWFMGGLDLCYLTLGNNRRTVPAAGKATMNIEDTWATARLNNIQGRKINSFSNYCPDVDPSWKQATAVRPDGLGILMTDGHSPNAEVISDIQDFMGLTAFTA